MIERNSYRFMEPGQQNTGKLRVFMKKRRRFAGIRTKLITRQRFIVLLMDVLRTTLQAIGVSKCSARLAQEPARGYFTFFAVDIRGALSATMFLAMPPSACCRFHDARCAMYDCCPHGHAPCLDGPAVEFFNWLVSFTATCMWERGTPISIGTPRLVLREDGLALSARCIRASYGAGEHFALYVAFN